MVVEQWDPAHPHNSNAMLRAWSQSIRKSIWHSPKIPVVWLVGLDSELVQLDPGWVVGLVCPNPSSTHHPQLILPPIPDQGRLKTNKLFLLLPSRSVAFYEWMEGVQSQLCSLFNIYDNRLNFLVQMVSNSLGVEQEEGGEDTSEETQSLEGMSQEDTLELEEEEEANQTQTTIEGEEEEEPMETSLDDCEDKEMEEEEEESLPDVNFGGLELERRSKKAILGRILSNLSHPDKLRFRRVAKLWKCAIDEPQMVRLTPMTLVFSH